jgi:hypothetical protein
MLSTDRKEFEAQVAMLCAGFGISATPERQQAFWTGMAKMSLIEFGRCVEFALSEEGPDKLPTTKGVWRIHREIKSSARATTQQVIRRGEDQDHLLYYANRMFLRHLAYRSGLGSTARFVPGYGLVDCKASEELLRARAALRETVNWFCGPIREGDPDATPHAFVSALVMALGRVSPIDPRAQSEWERMIGEPNAMIPFPAYMGRELPVAEPRQLDMA